MERITRTAASIADYGATLFFWSFAAATLGLVFVMMPILIVGFFSVLAFQIHPIVGVVVAVTGGVLLASTALTELGCI